MSANRWLRLAVLLLAVVDVALAAFWHPLPPAHLRELPPPAPVVDAPVVRSGVSS